MRSCFLTFLSHLCLMHQQTVFTSSRRSFPYWASKICEAGPGPDQSLFCNSEENMREEKKGGPTDVMGNSWWTDTVHHELLECSSDQLHRVIILGFFCGVRPLTPLKWTCLLLLWQVKLRFSERPPRCCTHVVSKHHASLMELLTPVSHCISCISNKICSVNDFFIKIRSLRINKSVLLCLIAFK